MDIGATESNLARHSRAAFHSQTRRPVNQRETTAESDAKQHCCNTPIFDVSVSVTDRATINYSCMQVLSTTILVTVSAIVQESAK